jgi:peptidyl-prolyl cis-trans isomerase D
MLKILRKQERAKKIIFWLLISVMVLAFVLWGAGAYKQGSIGTGYAGKISGRAVSITEFRRSYLTCLNDARLRFGENYRQLIPYLNLRAQAWTKLALLEYAKNLKIRAADQEVAREITAMPLFFRDGVFNQDTYEKAARYFLDSPPRDFEEHIRGSLIIKKLYERMTRAITTNDEETLADYKRKNETVNILYLKIGQNDFLSRIAVTDDELKSYYQANAYQFKRPPPVENGSFIPDFEEVKGDIRETLESRKAKSEAKKKIEELKNQIDEVLKKEPNLTLKEMAFRFGVELKTTPQFKRFEPLAESGITPQIQLAAFNLKPGEISALLESPNAYFLIEQDTFIGIDEEKFKQEKETHQKNLLEEKKQRAFDNFIQELIAKSDLKDYGSFLNLPE